MKTGIELIAQERERQISIEGYTPEHDEKKIVGINYQKLLVYFVSPLGTQGIMTIYRSLILPLLNGMRSISLK